MILCCTGTVTVHPAPPRRRLAHWHDTIGRYGAATTDLDLEEVEPAWNVVCASCGRVLAHVEGPREEVFTDL